MTVLNVPYIRNNATGAIEPIKVLRDDIVNGVPLDLDPLPMPRLNFGHDSHQEAGPVVRQHATTPNTGTVVSNGVDTDPLVMPKLDFSHRVDNAAACGCQKKVSNNSIDEQPLVAPKLDFSNRR